MALKKHAGAQSYKTVCRAGPSSVMSSVPTKMSVASSFVTKSMK
jgi:hypothetical protein